MGRIQVLLARNPICSTTAQHYKGDNIKLQAQQNKLPIIKVSSFVVILNWTCKRPIYLAVQLQSISWMKFKTFFFFKDF